jgi:serine protease AprX
VGLFLRRFLRAVPPALLFFLACALPVAATAHPAPDVRVSQVVAPVDDGAKGEKAKAEKGSDDDDESDDDGASGGGHGKAKPQAPEAGKPEPPAAPEPSPPASQPAQQPELDSLASNDKVDPALAAVARELGSIDPATPLRVLVFGDGVSAASENVGADVRREVGGVTSVSLPVGALAALVAQHGVGFVALDVPVRPTVEPDALPLTAFPLLDEAPYAWSRGHDGRGVGVAVLDSGVGAAEAFGNRLVHVELGRGSTSDTHGHGTFVAGVLAGMTPDGAYTGIAPGSRVFDVNVSQPDGVYTSDVIAGLEWVLANHRRLNIRVVNLSLAETVASSYWTNPLDRTVERLWRRGIVVVAAAGNLGPGSAVYAPANDPYVISVGALDQGSASDRLDDAAAVFSATGPTLDGFAKPDLLAPGRRIVSLLPSATTLGRQAPAVNVVAPGLAFMSGTSFAAPQVAGAAAILLQQHAGWTPDQVKWVLTRTTRPVAGSAAGTLDLRGALRFRGKPAAANGGLPGGRMNRFGPDGVDFGTTDWSSNTWSSNTWSSNTWSSNTWSSNTWSAFDNWFGR